MQQEARCLRRRRAEARGEASVRETGPGADEEQTAALAAQKPAKKKRKSSLLKRAIRPSFR